MGYEADQIAAENAESEGHWDLAYYHWNNCLAYVKRNEPEKKDKIEYLEMKMRDCKSRARGNFI